MADPYADLGAEPEEDAYGALGAEADPQPTQAPTVTKSPAPVPDKGGHIWATLKAAGEASGLVPRGVIPDERTARGAVATGLNGYALQWGDELAGLQSEQKTSTENMFRRRGDVVDPGWAYRNGRDKFRATEADFRAEHPAAAFALTTGASLMNPLGAFAVDGGGALNLARYAPSAAQGAVSGAGATDEAEGMGEAAAIGAPLSVAGQMAGEVVGDVAGDMVRRVGQSRLFTGIVQPSPAAQYLEQQGVNNLTIAQMAPGTRLAQLEEAASFAGGSGPAIRAMRQAGQEEWQRAAANAARPPGMTPIAPGTHPAAAQHAMDAGFDVAYGVAHGHEVAPDLLQAAAHAVDDPATYASNDARRGVANYLQDQFTALRLTPRGGVESGDVIALRSALRDRVRDLADATDGPSRQERALFQGVIEQITQALDASLPQRAAQTLRDADQQYARFMSLGDAVVAARDSTQGFTPAQLGTAVARNTPRQIYKQGGGGPLRALAAAGREALESRSPPTGAIAMVTGSNPVVPWINGFAMQTLNQQGPRAALLGRTALQQSVARGAAGAGAQVGPAMGRLGAAAERTWRAGVERGDQKSTSTIVESLATNNPEALGPYAQQIQQAAADGNLPLVHYTLQQTDPKYRAMIEAARNGGAE